MRKSVVAFTLVLMAVLVLTAPVMAGRRWCSRDPIVRVGGEGAQIWVEIPEEYVPAVNGPVNVHVKTPRGVKQQLIFVDAGFNGYGENVKFGWDDTRTIEAGGVFVLTVAADVPVDGAKLRAMGLKSNNIPFRIRMTTNGQLIKDSAGMWQVINGTTFTLEGTNYGTKMAIRVRPDGK